MSESEGNVGLDEAFGSSWTARRWAILLLLPVLVLASACARPARPVLSESEQFQIAVRELLNVEQSRPGYHDMRVRILGMGPEVDPILIALAQARSINVVVRSNALVMLAERRAPGALVALERSLGRDSPPRVRAAAVAGAQRLAPYVPEAARLVRLGVTDPSRTVRLTALIALDVSEVETMRQAMTRERDPDVRQVARQLIRIAESRGAPLAADARGILRTTPGTPLEPQIVFRPAETDATVGMALGDLRLEFPGAVDVPLTSTARVVGSVVPAFFSADQAQVVFEAEGGIRVLELPTRNVRSIGPGLAPRVIPFTDHFVFLRERDRTPVPGTDLLEVRYAVYRVAFAGTDPAEIGELRARMRRTSPAGYSPVRRMVIVETPEGFGLRAEGVTAFVLPDMIAAWPRTNGSEPLEFVMIELTTGH